MKNSWKKDPHKSKEEDLKLEDTFPKRKKGGKKPRMNCKNFKSKPQKPEKTPPDEKQPVPNTTRMVSKTPKENEQAPLLPR